MTKHERAMNAAKAIRDYCQKMPIDCKGCIFNQGREDAVFFKGCILNDPDHLPETWQIKEEVKE